MDSSENDPAQQFSFETDRPHKYEYKLFYTYDRRISYKIFIWRQATSFLDIVLI